MVANTVRQPHANNNEKKKYVSNKGVLCTIDNKAENLEKQGTIQQMFKERVIESMRVYPIDIRAFVQFECVRHSDREKLTREEIFSIECQNISGTISI